MLDVSAVGAKIVVRAPVIGTVTISRFSDEGTPFEFGEIQVTGNSVLINGELLTWSRPVAYIASVTVIALSDEDKALRTLLNASRVKPNGNGVNVSNTTVSMTTYVAGESETYSNGRIVSGPTGPSASTEGKLSSRTYSFVFEELS